MSAFSIAFHHATPHGVLSVVEIPDSGEAVPVSVLARLPKAERALAEEMRGHRQPQFVGGRMALRMACQQLGVNPPPLLVTPRGGPELPEGVAGSISHKGTWALGMAAQAAQGTLGVDLETYGPPRLRIAERVLTSEELDAISSLAEDRRWMSLLIRFSIKEALYKALDPYLERYIGFHEAVVTPDLQGGAAVQLRLTPPGGPFEVDARYTWLKGRLLASVRARSA